MFIALASVIMSGIASAQDIVGSFGCSMPVCVFANPYLRFGTGAETSVNAWGLFQQPWYYSFTASTWYKLTFSNYPLDTAIGFGSGGPNWSGATVVDLYSLTNTAASTNYSGFIVEKAGITIILPDIINLYLSLTIINSSSNDITIESDNSAHLLYNSIFINPNGEFSYKLPSSKMVIANNVKKGLGWIWSVIVS
jgi:hypothetical protein